MGCHVRMSTALLTATVLVALSMAEEGPVTYAKHQVLRLGPLKFENETDMIRRWTKDGTLSKVRALTDLTLVGNDVTVIVAPEIIAKFKADMEKHNIPFKVISTDFKEVIDRSKLLNDRARKKGQARRDNATARMRLRRRRRRQLSWWTGCRDIETPDYYMTNDEMNHWLAHAARCSYRARLFSIGYSYEGRMTLGIAVNEWKWNAPAIWINAGIHAREWISHSTALYIIYRVLYGTDDDAIYLRNHYRWYIFPNLNPDGYDYTWTTDRLWRKTRSPTFNSTCYGVDVNRNFNFTWGRFMTSKRACSDIYGGTGPFSEVETRNVRDAILHLGKQLKIAIDLHSFAQLWLLPYGGSFRPPSDYPQMRSLANKAVEAIKNESGLIYKVGFPFQYLYPLSGSLMDWEKASANIKYPYNPEMRPNMTVGAEGFVPGPDQIVDAGREMFAAVTTICREVEKELEPQLNNKVPSAL